LNDGGIEAGTTLQWRVGIVEVEAVVAITSDQRVSPIATGQRIIGMHPASDAGADRSVQRPVR